MGPIILETERLLLRWLHAGDAPFILQLVNEPSWLQHIGDRGVRTLADAARYIQKGPVEMYARLGFGTYLVVAKQSKEPLGVCGLIRRETLAEVDLGFAFLPQFWGQGFAYEAARATLDHECRVRGFQRVLAVVSPDNHASRKLLVRLGFHFERDVRLGADPDELKLYSLAAGAVCQEDNA